MNKCLLSKLILNGRCLIKDQSIYLFNTGSYVRLYFKGKKLTYFLSAKNNENYIYIIIDKKYSHKTKYFVGSKQEISIDFEDKKEHVVDFIKSSEATNGYLKLTDISFDGEIDYPLESSDINIRVYGDSTVAGYGILGKMGEEPSIKMCDGVEDFCFRALYKLDAHFDIFCASGWGSLFSKWTNPKTIGISHRIKYFSPVDLIKIKSEEKYNLLVISLGTNDVSYINENLKNKEKLIGKFSSSLEKIILFERKKNKNLPVLFVYGTLNEEDCFEIVEKGFEMIKNKYINIYIHKFLGDSSAIEHHAFVSYHDKMSEEFLSQIKTIL